MRKSFLTKTLFLILAALVSGASIYAQAQSCCDARTSNPPAFAWATKPTCGTAATGRQIRVTDVGVSGDSVFLCDGSNWQPIGGRLLLCQSGANQATTTGAGDTSEQFLATCTVPAGIMGANGALEIYHLWTWTNSGNTKTPRVRFSGQSGTVFFGNSQTTTVGVSQYNRIQNTNSASAQRSIGLLTGGFGTTANVAVTAAVDTTAATTVVLSCQKATGTETCDLNAYRIYLDYAP